MYQVGETVLYGTEGVCVIAEIREMKVGREKAAYYVLQPVRRGGATVFVPLGNEKLLGKMRRLLSPQELDSLLGDVCRTETTWIEDVSARKEEFRRILTAGDRCELLGMIRALYRHREALRRSGKHLRTHDEQTLRDAEKLLNDEFATVLKIEPREVPAYIRARLEGAQFATAEV